jgi:Na+/H+-dicarboxylate symporter
MLSPFVHHHVMGALFISIVLGMAIRYIPDQSTRRHTFSFFKGIHGIFLIITSWVVKIIPIALFGFICTTIVDCQKGINFSSLSGYFGVVILSNLVQGFLVLPIFLKCHSIRPFHALKAMMPALSVAFFSKSSAGALPVTIQTIENRLHVSSRVSRFVLPLCTSINMNGCAAFIFATVIYLMQNHGVDINFTTMILWIFIATIAAIGNAGIPMGCFFLSASLLTTMDIPINILGMILPIYSIIDMVETALNVWSDACVSLVVDKKETQLIKNNHVPIDQAS